MERTALIYNKGVWEPGCFGDLKANQIFRLVEPDGTPVDNDEICMAVGDALGGSVNSEPFEVVTLEHPMSGRISVYDNDGKQIAFVQRLDMRNKTVEVAGPNPGVYPFSFVQVH